MWRLAFHRPVHRRHWKCRGEIPPDDRRINYMWPSMQNQRTWTVMAIHRSTVKHRADDHRFWYRKSYHPDDHRQLWPRCAHPNNSWIAIDESMCLSLVHPSIKSKLFALHIFVNVSGHHSIISHKSQSMSMHCCRWRKIDDLESRYRNSIHIRAHSKSFFFRSIKCVKMQIENSLCFPLSDALSSSLSAFYAKIVVIAGIAVPVTEILTSRIPSVVYQSFYVYLYSVSIAFVIFVYTAHMRTRAVFSLIKSYRKLMRLHFVFALTLWLIWFWCFFGMQMRRPTTTIRLRDEQHILGVFTSELVPFRLASVLWCIRALNSGSILNWIVSWCNPPASFPHFNLNFSALCFRWHQLFDDYDGDHSHIANGAIHYPNAVHLPEYNRFGYGATQGDITIWIDAYGGNQSLRMAVRSCGRDKTRDSAFKII